MLTKCNDLYQAIHKVLELLRIELYYHPDEQEDVQPSVNHIFTSQLGISTAIGSLRQQAQIRFTICRNLLLICNILLERSELDWNTLEAIKSVASPEIVVLTQANHLMVWLSGLTALTSLPM